MPRAVGVDLGTKSGVSVFEGGEPTVIPNAEGRRTTPSVVGFSKTGEVLVGEVAKRQAITNPDRTIRSVKRHMGTNWTINIDGKKYKSQEISARILQKLKRDAEAYLGDTVTQAVVTVPAYFDHSQRQATKDAGTVAGLEVLRIISATSSAALAYGLDKEGADQTIIVFDLGGGTFDVSILEIGWDQRVVDWLVKSFKGDHGVDLGKDKMALQRLQEAAEKAKIELSVVQETTVNLPFVTATGSGPLHLGYELTRAKFQELTTDLVDSCKGPFQQVIKDAGLKPSDIDHVILVGGSTRMPAVQNLVQSLTKKEPHKGVNPDEVVAIGAAVQAGVLKGEVKDILFLDVIPRSLGIETLGGIMTKLIERNTTIPTKRTEVFTTTEDRQTSVEIHVLEGERELVGSHHSIGWLQVRDSGSPSGPERGQSPQARADETLVVDRPYLRVTTKSITFGQDSFPLDQIDGVAYKWHRETTNGFTTKMERLFSVRSHGRVLTIPLNAWKRRGGAGDADEAAWRTLVNLSNQIIEPRLAGIMLDRLRGGAPIQIGSVTISSSGLSGKAKSGKMMSLSWDGFAGVELEKGQVVITAKKAKGGRAKTYAVVPSTVMNAVLLPPVLRAAPKLFGR